MNTSKRNAAAIGRGSLLALALTLCAPMNTEAQKKWTLKECLDYAMQHNISLKKSQLKQQSANEDVRQSKAALLPSLSASTNHSVGYQPLKDSGVSTVTNGMVNTKVDKTSYNGAYSVNAQWTLWNGNRNRNTVKLGVLTEQQAELSASETANTLQENIAKLYVQSLYLTEAIGVNEATLATSRKNEERGQEMLNVGKMSKADLAQLSAQRSTDEYNCVEAQSQLANSKLQLRQLLELSHEEDFDVDVPNASDEMALQEIPALNAVYEAALAQRPEIQSAELAIKSSQLSVKMARAERMPTVNLSAGVGTGTNSLTGRAWGEQMKGNVDATAGVSISVPILDQRQAKTSINKAKLQEMSAQLDLKDKQKALYQTIEGYWLDAQTNQQKFRAARATVASEQQSYDLLQEQFRLGLKNIVELMTGKDKLLAAQQNLLQSKYMTLLNIQMLQFYQGGMK